MVAEGHFRENLYYRLNVFPIIVPPQRERPDDIEPLAIYFIRQIAKRYGMSMVPRLSEEALTFAKAWSWPGNVRELRNVMARAVLTGEPIIRQLDVSLDPQNITMKSPKIEHINCPTNNMPLPSFDEMQRRYFRELLTQTQGRISGRNGAADLAGMHPNTLRSRLEKLGIAIEKRVTIS